MEYKAIHAIHTIHAIQAIHTNIMQYMHHIQYIQYMQNISIQVNTCNTSQYDYFINTDTIQMNIFIYKEIHA